MAFETLDRRDLLRGHVTHLDGNVEFILEGEVDLSNADLLGRRLQELGQLSPGGVELDIAGLGFIDPIGLRVLVTTQRELGTSGRRLVIRHAPAHVRRLLSVSGLDAFLTVE